MNLIKENLLILCSYRFVFSIKSFFLINAQDNSIKLNKKVIVKKIKKNIKSKNPGKNIKIHVLG